MTADADGARAHGEAAGLDAGFAEGDRIGCGEFARESGESKGMPREHTRGKKSCSSGASGVMEEFAAFHGASPRSAVSRLVVYYIDARRRC
jgi:hypothetical protein